MASLWHFLRHYARKAPLLFTAGLAGLALHAAAWYLTRDRVFPSYWGQLLMAGVALEIVIFVAAGRLATRLGKTQELSAIVEGNLKRRDQDLADARELVKLLTRSSHEGVWDWDLESGQVLYSPQWKNLLGHEPHEVSNTFEEWEGRLHPEDAERVLAALRAHVKGETPLFEAEHRLRRRDQTHVWVLARGFCLRDNEGRAVRLAGIVKEIAEERERRAAPAERPAPAPVSPPVGDLASPAAALPPEPPAEAPAAAAEAPDAVSPDSPPKPGPQEEAPARAPATKSVLRLLLADSAAENRAEVLNYFAYLAFRWDAVEDVETLLEKVKAEEYDAVVLDARLPLSDGPTAVRALRAWEKEKSKARAVPVIALVPNGAADWGPKSMEAGCNAWLERPFKNIALLDAIYRLTGLDANGNGGGKA